MGILTVVDRMAEKALGGGFGFVQRLSIYPSIESDGTGALVNGMGRRH